MHGSPPVVVRCPGFSSAQGQKVMSDFEGIMKASQETMSLKVVVEWWMQREDLDERLMVSKKITGNDYLAVCEYLTLISTILGGISWSLKLISESVR